MKEPAYRRLLVVILAAILACNYVDRSVLGLVLQNIKADLSLSDTQLGFLTGLAFALFYAVMGVPIARWADQGDRVVIISVTAAMWSVAVALCGVAGSFAQLLIVRIGVAIGEAGCIPPAHSLIAASFTREERPRAVARYMLGTPLSVMIGYFVGGWLNELYGWRATFRVLGLPGLALATLAWFFLKEPRRPRLARSPSQHPARAATSDQTTLAASTQSSLQELCVGLWSNRTYRHLLLGFSILSFFGYGLANWQPAFFIRSFGLQTGELGTWFTAIYGLGGLLGTYWGGEWASRQASGNERLQLKAMAAAYCIFAVLSALTYLSPNRYYAFGLIALATVGVTMVTGPLFATIQTLVPDRMRATSIAMLYLFANLIGMGLGPLAVGALSDTLRPLLGEESLRYALLALCPGYLGAAGYLWKASQTVDHDLRVAQANDQSERNGGHIALSAPAKSPGV